jgi:hypothetical protein
MLTDEELARADFDAKFFVESLNPDGTNILYGVYFYYADKVDQLVAILESKMEQNTLFFSRQIEAVSIQQIQSSLKDVSLVAGIQTEALKVAVTKYEEQKSEVDNSIGNIVRLSHESHRLTSTIASTRQLQMMSNNFSKCISF